MNKRKKFRALLTLGYMTAPAFAFHWNTPNDPPAGGVGGEQDPPEPNDPPEPKPPTPAPAPAPQMVPKSQLDNAIKRRKKSEAAFKKLVVAIGGNPEDVEIVATNNPEDPYEIRGLEDVIQAFASNPPSKRPDRAAAQANARLTKLHKQNEALKKYVAELAIIQPIRAACIRQHAIDDDGGQFEDIVNALRARFRERFEDTDDETGDVEVFIDVIDAAGNAQFRADGEPMNAEDLVTDLLNKKPKFREPQHRAKGPGAGESKNGNRGSGLPAKSIKPEEKTMDAVSQAFGVKLPDNVALRR